MKKSNGMWLPDGDEFFTTRPGYEQFDYNRVMDHVHNNRVAVDIGAHVGYWSQRLVLDFDAVVAFEAHSEHAQCLAVNVFNNRCTIHTVALSDHQGTVNFSPAIANSGMSRVTDSGITIPCATLDSYGLTNVDLIKIDVEGHELQVLRGAEQTILGSRPVLMIEILNATPFLIRNNILKTLVDWNYRLSEQVGENYIFVDNNDYNN